MKYIFQIGAILLSTAVFGQTKIGPRVGVNLSNVSTDVASTTTNIYTSYSIGALVEHGLGETFALQVSVLASQKGYNFVDVQENRSNNSASNVFAFSKSSVVTSRGTRQFFYLDVPVSIVYKRDLGLGKVFGGLGGYYSYNFWGVSKETNTYVVGASSDLSLSTIDGNYDMRANKELTSSDYGLIVNAGLEFNDKAQLSFNYSYGLADIDPGTAKVQNRTMNISLAWFFVR